MSILKEVQHVKILYISNVFPRQEENSTIYTDLAEELNRRGHEIFVVASEEKRKLSRTRLGEERGIPVLRVSSGNLYDVSLVEKGITVLFLTPRLISAMRKYLKGMQFNFVLFESPPVTTAGTVSWAMRHFNCPSYLMLKDIFPQNGVDIGVIKKSGLIYRYFKKQEEELYRTASIIGCMSEANKEYILQKNPWLDAGKVEIFPNTKYIRYNGPRPTDFAMRRKYRIPEDVVVVVFGGNMGKPQGVGFLMDIISAYRDRKDVFFLLVGRGTERAMMRKRIFRERLSNVLMLDALPRNDYERLITECDIGLIFLDKRFTIPNFPSRVLSYFEYSMPVLAASDTNTDFGCMVEDAGAGYWVQAGDLENYIKQLDLLVGDADMRQSMGHAGRRYLEKHYNVGVSADILERRFCTVADDKKVGGAAIV